MIGWMLLIFFVGIGVLTILFRTASLLMARSFGEIVHRRHTDAEFILNTRIPPPSWRRRRSGRPRSRRAMLHNLRVLMGYFRNAPVFPSERDRVIMLRDMEQIRDEWKRAPLEELTRER
jgi:hypothetical protein